MNPATEATLKQLSNAEWFCRVGIGVLERRVRTVGSWAEALKECRAESWEEIRMEARNIYTEKLRSASPEAFDSWNDKVLLLRPLTEGLVERKCSDIVSANALPPDFIDYVRWDVLAVAMEAEYSGVISPAFYSGLAYWYANGHFPCGWDGIPPAGRMVIY
jgi:hypothetical protein